MTPNPIYEFGPFRLDPRKRLLWRDGEVVALKSKIFETLLVLVESHGRVLERDEIMRRLWPDTVVEENSLNKNISALRKLLGENAAERHYIVTVPARGYNFVASVRELSAESGNMVVATRTRVIIRQEEEIEEPATRSIAVLPFRWIGAESGDDYLGLGIADALITRLSRLRQMVVRPTSAIVRYAAPGQEAATVGRELRVAAVLEGGIRRAGERIRVSAQLVSASEGRILWGAQFDEKFTDIFAVEDRVSTQIAAALAVELTDEEQKQLHQPYTQDHEAYQLFWQGRYHINQGPQQFEKSLACFRQAVARDPNFAMAQVGLALCYCFFGLYELVAPNECYPSAQAAVARAIELDERLAEAHATLGIIKHQYEWDWVGAEKAFLRAIELNPNLAFAHTYYAYYSCMLGRAEALAEIARGQVLDPLSLGNQVARGIIHFYQREYEEAIAVLRRALEMDPAYYPACWLLGMAYEQLGAHTEAIAVFEQVKSATNLTHILPHLGRAYAIVGRSAEAEQALAELQSQAAHRYVSPLAFAHIYTGLGETDKVFEWLENAYQARDPKLPYLVVHPRWDSLRGDPRFDDLLRRMGLGS